MEQNIFLTIRTAQQVPGEPVENMELQTAGTLCREGDTVELSYVETRITGLEGVNTTFRIRGDREVLLLRDGEKMQNNMIFRLGEKTDSLYDVGFGALLVSVTAQEIRLDLDEGFFRVEYTVEVEHTFMGTNTYEVSFRPLDK